MSSLPLALYRLAHKLTNDPKTADRPESLREVMIQMQQSWYEVEGVWRKLLESVKSRQSFDEIKDGLLELATRAVCFYSHLDKGPISFEVSEMEMTLDTLTKAVNQESCVKCRRTGQPVGLLPYPNGPRWRFHCSNCNHSWISDDAPIEGFEPLPDAQDL